MCYTIITSTVLQWYTGPFLVSYLNIHVYVAFIVRRVITCIVQVACLLLNTICWQFVYSHIQLPS